MSSQQQNLQELPLSQEQLILPLTRNGEQTVLKPFCIRGYVLAYRQRDIFRCWPFPEKFLQACLENGIKNVLPPYETSLRDYPRQEKEAGSFKNEKTGCISDEGPVNHSSMTMPSTQIYVDQKIQSLTSLDSSKKKRRRRKGRQKKRSMVDILAVAKPCTLEDHLIRHKLISSSLYGPTANCFEGSKQTAIGSYDCNSGLTEEYYNKNLEMDSFEASGINVSLQKQMK